MERYARFLISVGLPINIIFSPFLPAKVLSYEAEPSLVQYVEPIVIEQEESLTVQTSCVLYLKSRGIPISGNASEQVPNLDLADANMGDVLLFEYGLWHVALIEGRTLGGWLVSECNYKAGTCGQRHISFDDPALRGAMRYE